VLVSAALPWGVFQGDFPSSVLAPSIVILILAGGIMLLLAFVPGPRRWQALVALIVAGVYTVAVVAAIIGVLQMGVDLDVRLAWPGPTAAFVGIAGYIAGAVLLLRASQSPALREESAGE
jgi:VIT1/CCC1 family predicted Fe2+/Mn2+ transporter